VSSVFDYLTFGVLLSVLHATQDQFRTGWFFESVISASLIVLVIRSRKPSFKSRPGKYLLMATLLTIIVTVILPFSPLGNFWIYPAVDFVPSLVRSDCHVLHCHSGDGEDAFLPEGEILKGLKSTKRLWVTLCRTP
jgi:glycerol uptake facilitator-like aquaporin